MTVNQIIIMNSETRLKQSIKCSYIPPRRRILSNQIPWTCAEDQKLTQLVETFGTKRWSTIAGKMANRTGKQCRERWIHHLDPTVNRSNWTCKEEWTLFLQHKLYGNKWAVLVKRLPGRTDNSIKNHWNSKMRKRLLMYSQQLDDTLRLMESDKARFETTFSAVELDLIKRISKRPIKEVGDNVIDNSVESDVNCTELAGDETLLEKLSPNKLEPEYCVPLTKSKAVNPVISEAQETNKRYSSYHFERRPEAKLSLQAHESDLFFAPLPIKQPWPIRPMRDVPPPAVTINTTSQQLTQSIGGSNLQITRPESRNLEFIKLQSFFFKVDCNHTHGVAVLEDSEIIQRFKLFANSARNATILHGGEHS